MKNVTKRTVAAALMLVMVLGIFTGCKKNGDDSGDTDPLLVDQTTEYAYVPSFVSLPEEITDMYNSCVKGDTIYYAGSVAVWPDGRLVTQEEQDEFYAIVDDYYNQGMAKVAEGEMTEDELYSNYPEQEYTYEYRISAINIDGTNPRKLDGFNPLKANENYGGSYVQRIVVDAQGNLCVIENVYETIFDLPADFDETTDDRWQYYVSDKNDYYIRYLDDTGAETGSIHLNSFVESEEGSYFYVDSFATDAAGNLYFSSGNESLIIVDPNGTVLAKLELGGYIYGYITSPSGEIGVAMYSEADGKTVIKTVNLEGKSWGDTYDCPPNAYNFYSGGGQYDFCYNTGSSLYGYDMESGIKTKIVTWLNNDVNGSNLNYCNIKENGDIFIISNNYSRSATSPYEVVNLARKPVSEMPQKEAIVLACAYLDEELRTAILNYNRKNQDYRIEVQDYSEYSTEEDYNAGITKLNTEIISGKVPDIISTYSLPIDQYAAKGLLEDLYPYIDNDSEFSRDDFVQSIFSIMENNGKLHAVTSNFNITTIAGKSSILGAEPGWTMQELQALVEAHPDADYPLGQYMTRDSVFSNLLVYGLNNYVDWMTGEVSFDSDEFKSLLEFANSFPEAEVQDYGVTSSSSIRRAEVAYADEEYLDDATLIAQGRMLATFYYMYDLYDYQYNKAAYGGDIVFKGIPGEDGGGNAANINSGLSMTTSCKNKDAAWEFVRTILTEKYQENLWSFPTNKKLLDKKFEEGMKQEYDAEGNPIPRGSYGTMDGETIQYYALTKEEVDQIKAVIDNIKYSTDWNSSLITIINDEATAYFAGEKSLDETAALIQSRMRIYVNEQR